MEHKLVFDGKFEVRKLLRQEGPWTIAAVHDVHDSSKRYLLFRFAITANVQEDRKRYDPELRFLAFCRTATNPLLPNLVGTQLLPGEEEWLTDWFDGLPLSKVLEMGPEPFALDRALTSTLHFAELLAASAGNPAAAIWFQPPFESHLLVTSGGALKVLPKTFLEMMTGPLPPGSSGLPPLSNATMTAIRGLVGLLYFLLTKVPLSVRKSHDEQLARIRSGTTTAELDDLVRSAIDGQDLPPSLNAFMSLIEMLQRKARSAPAQSAVRSSAALRRRAALAEWKSQLSFYLTYRLLKWAPIGAIKRIGENLFYFGDIFAKAMGSLIASLTERITKLARTLRKLTVRDIKRALKEQYIEAKQQFWDLVKLSKDTIKDVLIPLDLQLVVFTRELSILVKAGVSYPRAFSVLHRQATKPSLKEAIERTYFAISSQGVSLSTALTLAPRIFSETYRNIVKAGEASGSVDKSLSKIADLMERTLDIKRKVKSALTYPIFVLAVCIGVFFLFANHILPVFLTLFESTKIELPAPTKLLMGLVRFVQNPTAMLATLAVFLMIFYPLYHYRRTILGSVLYDRLKFRIPLLGRLIRLVVLANFCRTLASLYSCGIQLIHAVEISGKSVGNAYMTQVAKEMGELVRAGGSLPQLFLDQELFPSFVYHMARVGEETGEVQEMLERVSIIYDRQVESTLQVLVTMLDPILIGILGAIVCFVVLALFLPLYQFLNAV